MVANLEFTNDEYNVMTDATFFIQKKNITDKLIHRLGKLNSGIENLKLNAQLPVEVKASQGKISRGENYEQQPYLILDNPRVFSKTHVFAFRTLFLWGNFFSCTIHLSGLYFDSFKPQLQNYLSGLKFNPCYIGTGNNEWQHHFREDNYTPAEKILADRELLKMVRGKPFFKIALQLQLGEYKSFEEKALLFYGEFLEVFNRE